MSLFASLLKFKSKESVAPSPKKEFPIDSAGISALLSEMAPTYDPDQPFISRNSGVRGLKFRYSDESRRLHGYVKTRNLNLEKLRPIRASKPVYTFPHTVGMDFATAPDGVYTWVLYEDEGRTAFAATRIENKMEIGTGHHETLIKLGITKRFKVYFAGELSKQGHVLAINLSSGSYMLYYIQSITHSYNITASDVNSILIARAQNLFRTILGGFDVRFDIGAHEKIPMSVITSSTTPLTYDAMKELTNVDAVKFNFISNNNLRKHGLTTLSTSGGNGLSLPNWHPFLPETSAIGGAGAISGGGAASGTTRKRRQHRKRKMTRRH